MQSIDLQLREKAYNEITRHKELVESDPYRQSFHHMPPVGLLNDPNGFIHWNDQYHIFFQWMPFKTEHGAKFWGHYTSKDFVHWNFEPIALTPSDWYDRNGCYSGSAIEHDGKLYLFYTGNVKDEHNNRETYQCLAVSEDGIHFTKKGPIIRLPEGYTAHFRDPKVWKHNGNWYMIIGAQTSEEQGCAVLYQSTNLTDWSQVGELANSNESNLNLGYMWECPDLFHLDDVDVFLFSPQGIESDGMYYNNVYQSGYLIGELDYEQAELKHGSFIELDRGFDFYAPQTTLDQHGRRLLIGWMGVPEQNEKDHPTREYKWIHNLTIPRELHVKAGKVYQTPIEEMKNLRQQCSTLLNQILVNESLRLRDSAVSSMELFIDTEVSEASSSFEVDIFEDAKIIYNKNDHQLSFQRYRIADNETEYRSCHLNDLKNMRIFLDCSSIEIFVNDGEEVFSSRFFPKTISNGVNISSIGQVSFDLFKWNLREFTYTDSY